jgi:guanylate kinase
MNDPKLIIFSAPSGAGKSSLIKKLIELGESTIELSVSVTTREPRDGEVHGTDYFFISEQEFLQLEEQNAFLESANVHGFHYATLRSFVDEKTSSGISVILDIDVQGFEQVKQNSQNNLSIFILPPSLEELEKRLFNRGSESAGSIKRRLENALIELRSAEMFDFVVVNDEFDKTIKTLSSILFDGNIEYNDDNAKNILKELLDN